MADEKHEVIQAIKKLAADLGRAPSRNEFRDQTGLEWAMRRAFKSYAIALQAAGFTEESLIGAGDRKPTKFKYERQKLQGFFVDTPDLKELFKRAGNPAVLKLTAQPDTHVP